MQHIYRLGDEVIFCSITPSTLDFKVECHTANDSERTTLEFSLLEAFQLDNVSEEVQRYATGLLLCCRND